MFSWFGFRWIRTAVLNKALVTSMQSFAD